MSPPNSLAPPDAIPATGARMVFIPRDRGDDIGGASAGAPADPPMEELPPPLLLPPPIPIIASDGISGTIPVRSSLSLSLMSLELVPPVLLSFSEFLLLLLLLETPRGDVLPS